MVPSTSSLQSWGDESVRSIGIGEPLYLLAAVVSEPGACESHRADLRRIHRKGHKLHWRDLRGDEERSRTIDLIATFDVTHLVIVGTPVDLKRQERARARCLEHLAWQLDSGGVERLTLESRQAALDKRDLATIEAMRGKRHLSKALRLDHERPSGEPMLWIADQVLGAFGESLSGGESAWFDSVRSSTTITYVDV